MNCRPTSRQRSASSEIAGGHARRTWSATDPAKLTQQARAAIEDGANDLRISTVSVWEIAIKQSLGKLDLPLPAERWLPEILRRTGFDVADVSASAALRVRSLPWHHRDPFDRLLVAHALEDGYTILTRDEVLQVYGVPVLLA